MAALLSGYLYELTEVLKGIAEANNQLTALPLTVDEYYQAFVSPEHVERIREVAELVASGSTWEDTVNATYSDAEVNVTMGVIVRCSAGVPVLVPQYAKSGIVLNSDTEGGKKVARWLVERARQGAMINDVNIALQELNGICGNTKALSLVLPALSSLLQKRIEGYGRDYPGFPVEKSWMARAIKNIGGKTIGTLPRVSGGAIDRIRTASAFVQALCMVDSGSAPRPKGPVVLRGRGVGTFPRVHPLSDAEVIEATW